MLNNMSLRYGNRKQQAGAALITSLVVLVVMTLLALSSMRGSVFNSKMVRNIQTTQAVKAPMEGVMLQHVDMLVKNDVVSSVFLREAITFSGRTVALPAYDYEGVRVNTVLQDLTEERNEDADNRVLCQAAQMCGGDDNCHGLLVTATVNLPQVGTVVQTAAFGFSGAAGGTAVVGIEDGAVASGGPCDVI